MPVTVISVKDGQQWMPSPCLLWLVTCCETLVDRLLLALWQKQVLELMPVGIDCDC